MTAKKELHYFYVNYARGQAWYEAQFEGAGEAKARGEISPDYMYTPEAMANIARDLPDVRLFAILRNPVDRAISAYALRHERNEGMTFSTALKKVPSLVNRGLYTQHLDAVYSLFTPSRVKVLLYDDLVARPGAFLDELFEFIGVRTGVRPEAMGTRYNRVIYPGLQKKLQRTGLNWAIEAVKLTPVGRWIRDRNAGERRASGVATREDLDYIRRAVATDVAELSRRLGRDLGTWLR